ncbi:MAG TPA: ABC transporter substrate-binding protein [Candidatus Binatia bacterium]|jgi:putative ABC transport system substrate-binding protein|nr:ABC transporter substrate-binding protein [Candidatus Binatia bacterium]
MNKRILVWLLATLLLTTVCPADAQQPKKVPAIGYLTLLAGPDLREEAFLQGLHDLGYIDGQNITIVSRWAAGKVDRLPELAEELVRLKAEVIVARATPAVQAAKNATTTIPIVMMGVADAVGSGFVASLARPGGNITGVTNIMPELAGKRLELLREVLPKLSRVAFLAYGPDPAHKLFVKEAQQAAERLGMKFQPLVITAADEIESAFSAMTKERAGALIIQPLFSSGLGQGKKIAELAVRNRLPSMSDGSGFPEAGGLMLYGPNQLRSSRRVAVFVDKILKGAKPGDLPVEQPTTFEFVINLKTAKQIGLTIPQSVLYRADRVIK